MFIFSSVQLYKGIGLIPYLLLHHSVHSCLTLRTYPVLRTNIDIWTESKIEQTETFLKIKGVWLVKSAQQKPFILLPLLPDVYKGRSQKSILIQISTWPNTCYNICLNFYPCYSHSFPISDSTCWPILWHLFLPKSSICFFRKAIHFLPVVLCKQSHCFPFQTCFR